MPGEGRIDGVQQNLPSYAPITVENKSNGERITINFRNETKITGNKSQWQIRDGKLCDKDGKPLEEQVLRLNSYQVAIIKGADRNDDGRINENDYTFGAFGSYVDDKLEEMGSEYIVEKHDNRGDNAEASGGRFTAYVAFKNTPNEQEGGLDIDIRSDAQRAQDKAEYEAKRAQFEAEMAEYKESLKPWWKKIF